jgi:uncharacterized cupredoxin-like copper-binding protein
MNPKTFGVSEMRRILWAAGLSALAFGLAGGGAGAAVRVAEQAPVTVRLAEFQLELPPSLPAGQTTFSVTNAGQLQHNFEIKSVLEEEDPVEQPLPPNLQPGEVRTIQVELTPGTYMAECPLLDHAERGMKRQVAVTP